MGIIIVCITYVLVLPNVQTLLEICNLFGFCRENGSLGFLGMESNLFHRHSQHRQDFLLHNLAKPSFQYYLYFHYPIL